MESGQPRIQIDPVKIKAFCEKWKIKELSLFGSVLRDDFGPESDVDVLVSYSDGFVPRIDDILNAEEELKTLFGRDVDLVDRLAVEQSHNYIRRRRILGMASRIYAR